MLRSGAALMIYASACFSVMAAVVKHLSADLPVVELVFLRSLLALPVIAFLVRRRHRNPIPIAKRLMLIRIVLGAAAMTMFFFALGELPITDALLLAKMQPLWIALLAPVVLKERASPATVTCIVISLVGVVLVLQPSLEVSVAGGLAILASTLLSSLAHMSVRRLSATDEPDVIVLGFVAGTTLLILPFALPFMVWPTTQQWLWLVVIAAAATTGQLLMTRAYATEEAPVVAAAGYATVVYGVLLGVLVWDEWPAPLTWAGGAVLITAGLALVWSRRRVAARAFGTPSLDVAQPLSGSTRRSR